MFQIYKLKERKYLIREDDKIVHIGNAWTTMNYLVEAGIEEDEVWLGLQALEHHDMADFGINGDFIYSKRIAV